MDIQSTQSARLRWLTGAGSSQGVGKTQTGSVADTGEAGFHGAPTGKTMPVGGMTATNHSLVDGLGSLELPTAESVAADRAQVGEDLRLSLAIAGIETSPPISFSIDKTGAVQVAGDDPRAEQVKAVLAREPELGQRLGKLVSDAQFLEQGKAVEGWHAQVNAGRSPDAASRDLLAAAGQISAATGFTLDGQEIGLECDGLGVKLMPADMAPASDEEKMWSETLRLTERTRRTGVTAAAEAAEAEEKDRDKAKEPNKEADPPPARPTNPRQGEEGQAAA